MLYGNEREEAPAQSVVKVADTDFLTRSISSDIDLIVIQAPRKVSIFKRTIGVPVNGHS